MSAIFEGRRSDSPYVEMIWRGHVERDYAPVCPADVRWNLLFVKEGNRIQVSAEGATTHFVPKVQSAGREFLVIKFRLGVFMPHLSAGRLLNGDALLPQAAGRSFWLQGAMWQLPDFENAEAFVARLVREGVIVREPVVSAILQAHSADVSSRTVRRRFLRATGLTPTTIGQIERAQSAAALLEQGLPILDVVHQVGYADQPHLTRSLRRFVGQTPAQIQHAYQQE
jgi:AraC-like DNA-binding protein